MGSASQLVEVAVNHVALPLPDVWEDGVQSLFLQLPQVDEGTVPEDLEELLERTIELEGLVKDDFSVGSQHGVNAIITKSLILNL